MNFMSKTLLTSAGGLRNNLRRLGFYGMGDVVANLAKPVVFLLNFGKIDLGGCKACAERRAHLNAKFPF